MDNAFEAEINALLANGTTPSNTYHQQHPFWLALGERVVPVLRDTLGELFEAWRVRVGWFGGAGNMNLTADGAGAWSRAQGPGDGVKHVTQALQAAGFQQAQRQPTSKDASMWMRAVHVPGVQPAVPVYVRVMNSFGDARVTISLGNGASYPD